MLGLVHVGWCEWRRDGYFRICFPVVIEQCSRIEVVRPHSMSDTLIQLYTIWVVYISILAAWRFELSSERGEGPAPRKMFLSWEWPLSQPLRDTIPSDKYE